MKIYVIRHGETKWNIEKKLQGRADISLNDKGKKLAELTGEALSNIRFDICFSSPLIRTIQTADSVLAGNQGYRERAEKLSKKLIKNEIISEDMLIRTDRGLPIIKAEELIEISFGSWEGLSTDKDNYEIPIDNFSRFFDNPYLIKFPKDAESIDAVKQRTSAFLKRITEIDELNDKNILFTTHGFSMRALLNPLYEDSSDFWQEHVPYNCETAVIEAREGRIRLLDRGKIYYDAGLASTYK